MAAEAGGGMRVLHIGVVVPPTAIVRVDDGGRLVSVSTNAGVCGTPRGCVVAGAVRRDRGAYRRSRIRTAALGG